MSNQQLDWGAIKEMAQLKRDDKAGYNQMLKDFEEVGSDLALVAVNIASKMMEKIEKIEKTEDKKWDGLKETEKIRDKLKQ